MLLSERPLPAADEGSSQKIEYACVAQLVVQLIRNGQVLTLKFNICLCSTAGSAAHS